MMIREIRSPVVPAPYHNNFSILIEIEVEEEDETEMFVVSVEEMKNDLH